MTQFEGLLAALTSNGVKFIVVGGAAAIVHGAARTTYDLDVVYERSSENLDRVVAAIAPLKPYPRGAPPGLPFIWDRTTLKRGLNFTLTSTFGDLDLLGEIPGGGTYNDLVAGAIEVKLHGATCLCVNLKQLIRAKRAAGRPKDFEALAELEAIEDESNNPPPGAS